MLCSTEVFELFMMNERSAIFVAKMDAIHIKKTSKFHVGVTLLRDKWNARQR